MRRQISLSFELIYLLRWLSKEGRGQLRRLIKKAVKDGVARDFDYVSFQQSMYNHMSDEELYNTVTDFMFFLEDTMIEELKKNPVKDEFLSKFLTNWDPSSNEPIN